MSYLHQADEAAHNTPLDIYVKYPGDCVNLVLYDQSHLMGPEVEEPVWFHLEETRIWLEQRFVLGSAKLGSPLLQYMHFGHSWTQRPDLPRLLTQAKYLACYLSSGELERWKYEMPHVPLHLPYNPRQSLYPDPQAVRNEPENEDIFKAKLDWSDRFCSAQDLDAAGMANGPTGHTWRDREAVKAWLEQRYRPGDASLGSPFLRYMKEFYEGLDSPKSGSAYMCGYFSMSELDRWGSDTGYCFALDWDDVPLYPDPVTDDSRKECIPVVRNKRKRNGNNTPNSQKRSDAGKNQDTTAYVGKWRIGSIRRLVSSDIL